MADVIVTVVKTGFFTKKKEFWPNKISPLDPMKMKTMRGDFWKYIFTIVFTIGPKKHLFDILKKILYFSRGKKSPSLSSSNWCGGEISQKVKKNKAVQKTHIPDLLCREEKRENKPYLPNQHASWGLGRICSK